MTTYQQRDNSGSLFKNDKRDKETQPNARGTALIDGVSYEVAAWTKTSKNGKVYQSLSFKRADEAARREHVEQVQGNRLSDQLCDEVPFTFEWR